MIVNGTANQNLNGGLFHLSCYQLTASSGFASEAPASFFFGT